MSTGGKAELRESTTPQGIALVQIFFAVVLGGSILEFRESIFPLTGTSVNFWALFVVYVFTFATWYSWQIMTGKVPYVSSVWTRIRSLIEAFCIIVYAYLLYIGTLLPEHFFGYVWGFVLVYAIFVVNSIIRHQDSKRPEPIRIMLIHGILQFIVTFIFTVWASILTSFDISIIWAFMFITLGIHVSYRFFLWRWVAINM
jgi:hypothetical protein